MRKLGKKLLWIRGPCRHTSSAYVQIAHALQARAAIAQRHLIQKEKHQRIRA